MEKIKNSFIKCFPAVLILCVVQMLFGLLTSWIANLYSGLFPEVTLIETIPEFVERFFSMQNLLTYPISLVLALITCPFQIGIYKFCFDKLKKRKPSVGAVFGFYRNPKSILCSVICIKLVNFIGYFANISEKFLRLYLKNDPSDIKLAALFLLPVLVIVIMLLNIVAFWILWFWEYAYAENPDGGLKNAYRTSVSGAIFVIPLVILDKVLFWIYECIVPEQIEKILKFIPNTVITCLAISLFFAAINGDLKSLAKLMEKAARKINKKGVEAAQNAPYNIGGSYVRTQNTFDGNDGSREETDK